MSCRVITFDKEKSAFVSFIGVEEGVAFRPEKKCDYYFVEDGCFIVKLNHHWISETELVGEILSKTGEIKAEIPHPGKQHGKISTSGLVSGDSKQLKLVIEPYGNSNSYFLIFDLSSGEFRGAGNTVR